MTAPPNSPGTPRPLLRGLIAVVAAWGLYLAIGATGWFTDKGLFDARRSVVVLICSGAFVTWWIWLVRSLKRPGDTIDLADKSATDVAGMNSVVNSPAPAAAPESPQPATTPRTLTNRVSLTSLATNLCAWGVWAMASLAWQQYPDNTVTVPLGWISVLLYGASAVMAMIGLSDPRRRRWQLAGLFTLLLIAAAFVAFVRIAS